MRRDFFTFACGGEEIPRCFGGTGRGTFVALCLELPSFSAAADADDAGRGGGGAGSGVDKPGCGAGFLQCENQDRGRPLGGQCGTAPAGVGLVPPRARAGSGLCRGDPARGGGGGRADPAAGRGADPAADTEGAAACGG